MNFYRFSKNDTMAALIFKEIGPNIKMGSETFQRSSGSVRTNFCMIV